MKPSHSSRHELLQRYPLDAQEGRLFAAREQQQVVDETCDPCDLGLDELLDATDLLRRRMLLRREHFELALDHRQRRAQLVRGVGDERALTRERIGETIEHVVEGVGQHPDLAGAAIGLVHAVVQVARVDLRRHRGHPAQRVRQPRADQQRREQRARQSDQPGEDEGP